MTPEEFADAVRDDNDTALSRLGSSKSLYAATGGEMDADAVLAAAADAEHHARETFHAWADDEPDAAARELFAAAADEEADHYDTVVAELDADHDPTGDPPAIQTYLRDRHDTVERAGAFVGRALAAGNSKRQLVGFFVGEADPATADTFRDLADDVDEQLDRGLALLGELCDGDDDWAEANAAATGAIQEAYDEYVDQLQSMGVNPKPVC